MPATPGRPLRREHRLAEAGVGLVMVFWAANFIVVKAANREIPPITFSLLRFGLAAQRAAGRCGH